MGIWNPCHPRENGDPVNITIMDSRLRGNDIEIQYLQCRWLWYKSL